MGRYYLTQEAQNDISEIAAFIKQDSPTSALNVVREIRRACGIVAEMPGIGHLVDDVGANDLYRLPAGKYTNYIIFYVIEGNQPVVVRVLHAKRDIPTLLEHWYGSGE